MSATFVGTGLLNDQFRAVRSSLEPEAIGDLQPSIRDRFTAVEDRLHAEDYAAARALIAELRIAASGDGVILREVGRASLIAQSPRDAVQDLEAAKRLAPQDALIWLYLGLAKADLDQTAAALEALAEAERLDPSDYRASMTRAAIAVREPALWRSALINLLELHDEHPDDEALREVIAEAYLARALDGWTRVEADNSGSTLVGTATKLLRMGAGSDIEPGLYATEAGHVKTAADCVARLRAINPSNPALQKEIEELDEVVRLSNSRHFRATGAEIFVGAVLLLGSFMLGEPLAVIGLAPFGLGILVGSLEPQYRSNKIMILKRGKTLGDAVIGLAKNHQYGGMAYSFMIMATWPFVAAYKMYMNWGKGWLAKSDLADLRPATVEVAEPDVVLPQGGLNEIFSDARDVDDAEQPESYVESQVSPALAAEALPPSAASVDRAEQVEIEQEVASAPAAASVPLATARSSITDLRPIGSSSPRRFVLPTIPRLPAIPRTPKVSRQALLYVGGVAAALGVIALAVILWPMLESGIDQPAEASERGTESAASTPTFAPLPTRLSGRPEVVDTAHLRLDGQDVALSGVVGEGGAFAQQMDSFIQEQGGIITCQSLSDEGYRCWTGEDEEAGYDLAAAVIANGGGRAAVNASEEYQSMEQLAQTERRGLWQ